jgi:polyribonucleotide nucleotidyltransferase
VILFAIHFPTCIGDTGRFGSPGQIAMGMFLEDTHASTLNNAPVIVSDISGTEDALATMEFKVILSYGTTKNINTKNINLTCLYIKLQ